MRINELIRCAMLWMLLVAAPFSSGCGDGAQAEDWSATGIWVGSFVAAEGDIIDVEIRFDIVQEGTSMHGTAVMNGVPCFSSLRFDGAVLHDDLSFEMDLSDPDDPAKLIEIRGSFFPETDAMECVVTVVNWGLCTGNVGSVSAVRND